MQVRRTRDGVCCVVRCKTRRKAETAGLLADWPCAHRASRLCTRGPALLALTVTGRQSDGPSDLGRNGRRWVLSDSQASGRGGACGFGVEETSPGHTASRVLFGSMRLGVSGEYWAELGHCRA